MRVGKRETGSLRKILQQFPSKELANQPLPRYERTDDRYELLNKFKSILQGLGFSGIIVLMDRVDEPHLTGGKPELMRRFAWPLLDNKLLKHPGVGFKIMLPQELHRDIDRETREFHERARLDKQNVISAFQWTGESLYDLARARMLACAAEGANPEPKDLFSQEVNYQRMLSAFQSLRFHATFFGFFSAYRSNTAIGIRMHNLCSKLVVKRLNLSWRSTCVTRKSAAIEQVESPADVEVANLRCELFLLIPNLK